MNIANKRPRTTDTATTTFAAHLIHLFTSANNISDADLISSHPVLMLLIRGLCFGLNILSNIIMWELFTRALTAGSSTTKVSITNTAANFLVTAMLGMGVFGERVGGRWWVGAAMMGGGISYCLCDREGVGREEVVCTMIYVCGWYQCYLSTANLFFVLCVS